MSAAEAAPTPEQIRTLHLLVGNIATDFDQSAVPHSHHAAFVVPVASLDHVLQGRLPSVAWVNDLAHIHVTTSEIGAPDETSSLSVGRVAEPDLPGYNHNFWMLRIKILCVEGMDPKLFAPRLSGQRYFAPPRPTKEDEAAVKKDEQAQPEDMNILLPTGSPGGTDGAVPPFTRREIGFIRNFLTSTRDAARRHQAAQLVIEADMPRIDLNTDAGRRLLYLMLQIR